MKILITSHYFYPENFFINDIAKALSRAGNDVSVATGKPNYPQGQIYKEYKNFSLAKEHYDEGIVIYRVPIIPRGKSKFMLFLNYFSFLFFGLILFPYILKNKKFDIIFHFGAGPITSILPFILIKFLKKSKIVLWVQDLYPDTLKSFQLTNKKIILSSMGFLVKYIYLSLDKILIQSKSFNEPIIKYTSSNKIIHYPNSYIDIKKLQSEENKITEELKNILLTNKCFIFAGNIGEAQSVETLVKCAKELEDLKIFKLVLVGDGSKKDWIRNEIEKKQIDNIILAGSYSIEHMATIYDLAYGLVLTLKNDPHFDFTIPSKLQAYLSSGKPIVAAASGEAGKIIKESCSGYVCESENFLGLATNIRKLIDLSKEDIENISKNARKYYENNFEMSSKVNELIEIFKTVKKRNN